VQAFQFVVSVLAAWVFDLTIGQDPLLTPQAWLLGVILTGAGTAYLATVVIVRLQPVARSLASRLGRGLSAPPLPGSPRLPDAEPPRRIDR
jgi:hypothetical protein